MASIAAGTIPSAITALTVSAAARIVGNEIRIVFTASGFAVRRTAIFVAIPRVPSLPMNAPRRSNPSGSGSKPPNRVTSPSGRTTSIAKT